MHKLTDPVSNMHSTILTTMKVHGCAMLVIIGEEEGK